MINNQKKKKKKKKGHAFHFIVLPFLETQSATNEIPF